MWAIPCVGGDGEREAGDIDPCEGQGAHMYRIMSGTENLSPFCFSAHPLPLFGHGVKLSTSLSTQAIK